ncbi:hypothetical protein HYU14_06960 [Candidatus Woesearchaeota archaeon]|nr:hypothetical protein [Candidatus Woesearchaeota archaeon]
MTSIAVHKQHCQEHFAEIEDALALGMEKRPSTLGLHISACSISILELYLHALGKISIGAQLKHEWFKRPKPGQKILPLAERKIGMAFPQKEEIFSLMCAIEEERNTLIYGNPSREKISQVVSSFQKLKKLIEDELQKHGESFA